MSRKDHILDLIEQIKDCNENDPKLKCPHLFEKLIKILNQTICIENGVIAKLEGSSSINDYPTIRQQYKMAALNMIQRNNSNEFTDRDVSNAGGIAGLIADTMIAEDIKHG